MSTKPITLTLKASELRDLLSDVLPFADKPGSLPILTCIHLRGHVDHVTAAATDRYCVGVRKVHIEAPETLDANIDRTVVRQMLAIFKPTRHEDPTLTLQFSDSSVTVESTGGLDGLILDTRMSFSLYQGQYPALGALFDPIASSQPSAGDPSPTIRTDYLLRFKHLRQVTLHQVGPNEDGRGNALFVRAEDFIGAVMPLYFSGADEGAPHMTRDLTEWAAFCSPPKAPAKRRSRKEPAA